MNGTGGEKGMQPAARKPTGPAPDPGLLKPRPDEGDELPAVRARIRELVREVRILDTELAQRIVRERQESGIDRYDEVWEGVYVVPPLANNPHQGLVAGFTAILYEVIVLPGRGQVFPGANVSDRRAGWEHNYRDPDVVVVLPGSRAVDCTTHLFGGPDFLVEVESRGAASDEKIPFYSQLQVRELLVVHQVTRQLRLYRHDGQQLVPVDATDFRGKKWFVSAVVPLAFRPKTVRGSPLTEVRRTDGKRGSWTI
jgi:Uma2 family endonuclease